MAKSIKMNASALRHAGHISIQLYDKDISELKEGKTLEYRDCSENLGINIEKTRFSVVDKIPPQRLFIDGGLYRRYYPTILNPKTCVVKLHKERFQELLEKGFIFSRHGSNHLHIIYTTVWQKNK
ncbi:MAG: hypothetical protein ACOYT4_02685 [Nanoarchaeota archaeon]